MIFYVGDLSGTTPGQRNQESAKRKVEVRSADIRHHISELYAMMRAKPSKGPLNDIGSDRWRVLLSRTCRCLTFLAHTIPIVIGFLRLKTFHTRKARSGQRTTSRSFLSALFCQRVRKLPSWNCIALDKPTNRARVEDMRKLENELSFSTILMRFLCIK